MQSIKKLLFVFLTFMFFTVHVSVASEIKYSMGPKCDGNNVVCGVHEVPVCLMLEPTIHLVSLKADDQDINLIYVPSCNAGSPACANQNTGLPASNGDVVLECVEFIQCDDNVAHCSDGKTAKCLVNGDEMQGCNCKDGSTAVCDYTWEVSSINSLN